MESVSLTPCVGVLGLHSSDEVWEPVLGVCVMPSTSLSMRCAVVRCSLARVAAAVLRLYAHEPLPALRHALLADALEVMGEHRGM